MTYNELVLPSTTSLKEPLSYEDHAKDTLEKAKQAYASYLVSQLVGLYNTTDREESFAAWLLYTARTLDVLSEGDSHRKYELRNHAIKGLGSGDELLGRYIERDFISLARIWDMPELAHLRFELDGYARPLRITRPY
jgi:hypothetical protein